MAKTICADWGNSLVKVAVFNEENKDDFIKTFSEYYPYSRSFNSNISLTADLIIQPYFLENNNFCSLAIYDADISYDKIKKHIINNNLSKEITYNCSQINL